LAATAKQSNLASGMIAMRDKTLRRLGASLAGLALYLQLAIAGSGMLALATPDAPADGLGEHSLCLADSSGATRPAAPADNAPAAPSHDHSAFCCLWHTLPGVAPQSAAAAEPFLYARLARATPGHAPALPGPQRGPANARAPPPLV
jgi:hypothetical protein